MTTTANPEVSPWTRMRSLLAFGSVTAFVAILGSVATTDAVDSEWFASLEKPSFYPADSLFGVVWTILYVLIAVAGWLAWRNGGGLNVLVPWTIQIILNLGWSVFFFGAQQPGWALVVIIALLATSLWTAIAMWRHSHWASYLFVAYILWVAFATALNVSIVTLN